MSNASPITFGNELYYIKSRFAISNAGNKNYKYCIGNTLIIEDIEININKENIKNLHLSVHPPDGRVRISAPNRMSDEAIKIFTISKLSWIKKQQSKFQAQERQLEREFVSGESHYYQGKRYLLNVIYTNKKQRVEISNFKYINLYVRNGSTKEQREKVLTEWYRSQLKAQIPKITDVPPLS